MAVTESLDHVPAKTFFYGRLRPKGFEVPACIPCNSLFAKLDNFFALVAFMQASFLSSEKENRLGNLISSAAKFFPDATFQIAKSGKRRLMNVNGVLLPGVQISGLHPDIHFTIRFQVARMVAAQFYEACGYPIPEGSVIWTTWHSNAQPIDPEVLGKVLTIIPNYRDIAQGGWSSEKQFQARYQFVEDEVIGGCVFNFHSCFTGLGFVFDSREDLEREDEDQLFLVTRRGIEPVKGGFPSHLKLPTENRT